MRYIELFGGIGAATKALKKVGKGSAELVDYIEIDKNAVDSFNKIHGTNFSPTDIKENKVFHKNIDLIIAGFPCQPFSTSGNLKGEDDHRGAPLINSMINYIKKTKPKYILLENVKNFMSKNFAETREKLKQELSDWDLNFYVLNAKNFGIPQNRDRVFITNINLDSLLTKELKRKNLKDFLLPYRKNLNEIDRIYDKSDKTKIILDFNKDFIKVQNNTIKGYLEAIEGDCIDMNLPNCFTRRARTQPQRTNTLTTSGYLHIVEKDEKGKLYYRKLQPLEFWLLMGFNLSDYNKVSDKARGVLYKQAGNSIVVPVLENIFKEIM